MRYEFRVLGIVSERLSEAFPELDRTPVPDQTLFFGQTTDEAHLYGLLARFQSLGLHVVEMRKLPDPPAGSPSPGEAPPGVGGDSGDAATR